MSLKKKIKKELIGTSDYPSNKIFTISNFITFTRLVLTFVFLYLFITNENRYIASSSMPSPPRPTGLTGRSPA